MTHIYVDADSCPVKSEIYKVASRFKCPVTLVANTWMRTPESSRIRLEQVGDGFDEADNWIAEHVQAEEVVITADVLLASRCVKKRAHVLSPSGKHFTEDNIGQTVATRDLLADLRGAGEITGGPPPMNDKTRNQFLQQLHQILQKIEQKLS